MGFLRKKDDPYEVPEEVSGSRSEIDDFRARMRQQAGGAEARENPELAKLKKAYGDRLTDHLDGLGGRARSRTKEDGGDDFNDLLGGGAPLGGGSFASPEDHVPSGSVPGLDDDDDHKSTRPKGRLRKGSGGGGFSCNDCGTSFKESWSKCPKCGGKIEKSNLDPEVESLRAKAEGGTDGMRQVDASTKLNSLMGGVSTEFGRDNDGNGLRDVDGLLTDFSDTSASPAAGSIAGAAAGEGFTCKTCKTEYKEKWGKCPKCGGEVERALAPEEVSQLEHQHRDLENSGTISDGGGGSGMLGDLMSGTMAPPPAEPKPTGGGLTELDELTPATAEHPAPAQSPPEAQPALEDLTGPDKGFKPSSHPGMAPLEDLTQDLGLPDEEDVGEGEPETQDLGEEEEHELTREEVGIKQAQMSTDFSFAKPAGGKRKKVRKRTVGGQAPASKASGKRPLRRPPQGPAAHARPDPFARPPKRPVDMDRKRNRDHIPRPEVMESELLDMLREPNDKKRRT